MIYYNCLQAPFHIIPFWNDEMEVVARSNFFLLTHILTELKNLPCGGSWKHKKYFIITGNELQKKLLLNKRERNNKKFPVALLPALNYHSSISSSLNCFVSHRFPALFHLPGAINMYREKARNMTPENIQNKKPPNINQISPR